MAWLSCFPTDKNNLKLILSEILHKHLNFVFYFLQTTWLSALSSISTIPSLTVFERAINKLLRDIKEGLLPPQKIWGNSILFYSETIDYNVPLTSLASKSVAVEAVKLAKVLINAMLGLKFYRLKVALCTQETTC